MQGLRSYKRGRRPIRFDEFRQVVRRYRPSDLLPVLAATACRVEVPAHDFQQARFLAPWAFPVAARESVLWGNEHRPAGISADDVRVLFNAFNNIYEEREAADIDWLHSEFTRLAYEQFPYQESIFEELTRTHALLVEGLPHIRSEVLSEDAWASVLGAPLHQVVGATFLLQIAAQRNGGWFQPADLDNTGLDEVFDVWPREVILDRARRISLDFGEFKAAYADAPHPPLGQERYAFNPLTSHPFLRWPDGRFLAPQPHLILRTVTPGNLYYVGASAWGDAFTHDLGHLTEHYVGEQLRTIDGAEVHPEVVYGKKKAKSIDWFLVLPSLVVMFEAKSARFGLRDRFADPGFERRIAGVLTKAISQIERTSSALDSGDPAFGHIPTDRPRIGMVVTAEPYYLGNTPMVRSLLPGTTVPVLTASLRDLEHLVGLSAASIERQLPEIANDPERSTWGLGTSLAFDDSWHRSRVLQRAWDAYPWPYPDEAADGDPMPAIIHARDTPSA